MAKQEPQEQQAKGTEVAQRQGNWRTGRLPRVNDARAGRFVPDGSFRTDAEDGRRDGPRIRRVRLESRRGREKRYGRRRLKSLQADGKYLVRAELPGVNPGDVKLEITNEAVILQGERTSERAGKQGRRPTDRTAVRSLLSQPFRCRKEPRWKRRAPSSRTACLR